MENEKGIETQSWEKADQVLKDYKSSSRYFFRLWFIKIGNEPSRYEEFEENEVDQAISKILKCPERIFNFYFINPELTSDFNIALIKPIQIHPPDDPNNASEINERIEKIKEDIEINISKSLHDKFLEEFKEADYARIESQYGLDKLKS